MDIEELAAHRIRKARKARDLSQQAAADLVGVSQHAWATYENGTRKVSLKMLQNIATKLDFPIAFFIDPDYELVAEPLPKAQARRRKAA